MYKILRMVFAIIAAVLVAACIFVALYVSMLAFWCVIGGALLCFALSMFFKYLQEKKRRARKNRQPPPPQRKKANPTRKKTNKSKSSVGFCERRQKTAAIEQKNETGEEKIFRSGFLNFFMRGGRAVKPRSAIRPPFLLYNNERKKIICFPACPPFRRSR